MKALEVWDWGRVEVVLFEAVLTISIKAIRQNWPPLVLEMCMGKLHEQTHGQVYYHGRPWQAQRATAGRRFDMEMRQKEILLHVPAPRGDHKEGDK